MCRVENSKSNEIKMFYLEIKELLWSFVLLNRGINDDGLVHETLLNSAIKQQ